MKDQVKETFGTWLHLIEMDYIRYRFKTFETIDDEMFFCHLK